MSILRPRLVLPGFLGIFAGALLALAPAPSLAGARGLRASHAQHAVTSSRVQVSHGVEVLKGCGFDAARPGRLAPRPVAHRPLRGGFRVHHVEGVAFVVLQDDRGVLLKSHPCAIKPAVFLFLPHDDRVNDLFSHLGLAALDARHHEVPDAGRGFSPVHGLEPHDGEEPDGLRAGVVTGRHDAPHRERPGHSRLYRLHLMCSPSSL